VQSADERTEAAASSSKSPGTLGENSGEALKSPYKITKLTVEDPDLPQRFNRVLGETVEAMEEAGIRYAFIGGIASGGLGRPRSTQDIDLFVMPDDADLALRALAKHGFRTEKTDPSWLFKGFKDDILVDVIFKSKGEIFLDSEMYKRLITHEFHGKHLRLVAPEDLLIIKAAAHSELTPGHWHDAVALLSHASLDWDYLIRRAKRAPRRVLSLLLYAQSNDIGVPNQVITELFQTTFGNGGRPPYQQERAFPQPLPSSKAMPSSSRPTQASSSTSPGAQSGGAGGATCSNRMHLAYAVPHLRERLASDQRCNELDVQIEVESDRILLRGEVHSEERREAVGKITEEFFPGCRVENQLRLVPLTPPNEAEDVL
jgi:predicted nucleotidyltransferase